MPDDPTPATPPPAAAAVTLDKLAENLRSRCCWHGYGWHSAQHGYEWHSAQLCDTVVCRAARAIESLRAALAAAERERDDAAKVIADLRFNQSHLDAMRERWNELVAERDAARAEVERAFRAGCLAPVGALVASDEVVDRAWARYRQQRATAEDAKETKPC